MIKMFSIIIGVVLGLISNIVANWLQPSLEKHKKIVIGIFVALVVTSLLLSVDFGKETKSTSLGKAELNKVENNELGLLQNKDGNLKLHKSEKSDNSVNRGKSKETTSNSVTLSIQLSQKSNGYSSLFLDGEKLEVLPESTMYNPRIEVKNYTGKGLILIITNIGDSCWTSLPHKNSSNLFRIIPNCF